MRPASAPPATPLEPSQQLLLDQGLVRVWPIERRPIARALSRHLRAGSTKYARSIPTEGIESVTLSLCAAFWLGRAWLLFVPALILVIAGGGSSVAVVIGDAGLAIFGLLLIIGFLRLISAARSRSRFRRVEGDGGPSAEERASRG